MRLLHTGDGRRERDRMRRLERPQVPPSTPHQLLPQETAQKKDVPDNPVLPHAHHRPPPLIPARTPHSPRMRTPLRSIPKLLHPIHRTRLPPIHRRATEVPQPELLLVPAAQHARSVCGELHGSHDVVVRKGGEARSGDGVPDFPARSRVSSCSSEGEEARDERGEIPSARDGFCSVHRETGRPDGAFVAQERP